MRTNSASAESHKGFIHNSLTVGAPPKTLSTGVPQQPLIEQERLRAQTQTASGIAHGINNALTPIIGFSDVLLDEDSTLSGPSKKYLQHIRAAAQDIADFVEQIRRFYRRRDY